MSGITVAVVGTHGVASQLGKKSTQSDLTLFDSNHDDHHTTLVEPTQFPEKFAPLLSALAMADRCLLIVEELTRSVAETMATVELFDLPTTIATGAAVGTDELGRALRGSRLESAPRVPLDVPQLRETVDAWRAPADSGPVAVPLDHVFPVKGVGTVALGVVRRGTLRAHEQLRLWPTDKVVEIRSIQVHDVDVKEAEAGERVGVALKGVEVDQVERGQILAPAGSLNAGADLVGERLLPCRYYKGDWGVGSRMSVAVGMQIVPMAVEERSGPHARIKTDRPVVYAAGQPAYLFDLNVGSGPRIVARAELTSAR